MKKLSVILGLLLFCNSVVFANDVADLETSQVSNDNRAIISVQKQPATEEQSIQKQEIKQNKWCIIIQVNGKIKDNTDNLKK